jgi:hypothetical protein
MTNEERQKWLDRKKWEESYDSKKDMSGAMAYCEFCEYQVMKQCTEDQPYREQECACARAYNRMKRK